MADTPAAPPTSSASGSSSASSSGKSGPFGFLTRKLGPMPVWAYAAIGFGVYYWYTHYGPGASKNKQKSGQGGQGGQGTSGPSSSPGAGTVLLVGGGGGFRGPGGGGRGDDDDGRGRGRHHHGRGGHGNGHHTGRPRPRRFPGGRLGPVPTMPGGRVPGVNPGGPLGPGRPISGTTAAAELAPPPGPLGGPSIPGLGDAAMTPGDTTGVASEPQADTTAADLASGGVNPGGPDRTPGQRAEDRDRRTGGRWDNRGGRNVQVLGAGGVGLAGDANQPGGAASIYAPYDGRSQWKTATGWEAAAINYLIGEGVAPEEASTSVWTYLHGEPQSARMQSDTQLAIDGIGPPPGNRPPSVVKKYTPQRNSKKRPASSSGRRRRGAGIRVVRV